MYIFFLRNCLLYTCTSIGNNSIADISRSLEAAVKSSLNSFRAHVRVHERTIEGSEVETD